LRPREEDRGRYVDQEPHREGPLKADQQRKDGGRESAADGEDPVGRTRLGAQVQPCGPTHDGVGARPGGLEPPTLCLEGRCSIQLSYGRKVVTG
jgi:hypothetical protein